MKLTLAQIFLMDSNRKVFKEHREIIGKPLRGDANNERHFNGIIDGVRIYNRGLSEAEVLQNFAVNSNTLAVNASSKLATLRSVLRFGN